MTETNTASWIKVNPNEWRRTDGARVVRADRGWDVLTAGSEQAGNAPSAEAARRLSDFGGFERAGVLPLYPFSDDAGLPALVDCIRHLRELDAVWLESVPVHETHRAKRSGRARFRSSRSTTPRRTGSTPGATRRPRGSGGFMRCWGWHRLRKRFRLYD